eukprot:275720_1
MLARSYMSDSVARHFSDFSLRWIAVIFMAVQAELPPTSVILPVARHSISGRFISLRRESTTSLQTDTDSPDRRYFYGSPRRAALQDRHVAQQSFQYAALLIHVIMKV